MATGLEQQALQILASLLALAVTGAVSVVTPHLKNWLKAHVSGKSAELANTVIDGLGKIAESVVHDFDQRIVVEAKANGVFTPQLATNVKADAVRAVLDQGSELVSLGQSVIGNMPGLVSSLIEQAVTNFHVPKAAAPVASVAPAAGTAPTVAAAQ